MSSTASGRRISDLHENPTLIRFATTPFGKVVLWSIASWLIWPSIRILWISPLLALFLVRPSWRRELLCVGSIAFLFHTLASRQRWQGIPIHLAVVIGTLLLVYGAYRIARRFRALPMFVQTRPLVWLHAVLWVLMIVAWFGPPYMGEPWRYFIDPFRWILPLLAWRFSYLFLAGKRGTLEGSGYLDHLWYCLPSLGGTNVPYGKGSDYLNSNRKDDTEGIARVQLSGIKLLVLAKLWSLLQIAILSGVYGWQDGRLSSILQGRSLGLTRLGDLIKRPDPSLIANWASLFGELIYFTLSLAVTGHLIIGCLRLFGFNVFRNTYKPLLAETIVEFWNRLYYYFKELLVEFFLFPVFASYFKRRPTLRMFVAVMSAAFLGNVYYHVMRDFGMLGRAGPQTATELILPRVFYSFLLGIGVFVSMQRQQRLRGSRPRVGTSGRLLRLRNIAMVWLFFSLIHIWNVGSAEMTFGDRTRFFLNLFGLAWF